VRHYKLNDAVLVWTYLCLHYMGSRSNRARLVVTVAKIMSTVIIILSL